ncbi:MULTISPECIES: nuclease-related domain-containing protein [unclassified Streptomyces]|uniref:nuclease-related domain-containing protein n=1 Tax=unclassified Streptomyces TaxID=2593676 RepID=UPI00081DCE4F|nr:MULTISPECIES: nuclease-related domain-containing protein [unclassified Streptomyces]MYZ34265.1 NERD domain-containing protein [Streptomyces sp. SID4917]SCF65514.1 Nuclease-related domain-containing protein [Streptomyces sp. MnatMP-M17]
MTIRLRVTPVRVRGRDRLFVSLPDGTAVAWYDGAADADGAAGGRISVLPGAAREDVLAALAPYITGEVAVGPPPIPTPADLDRLSLHPDDDLAPNRPGEALHAELDAFPAPERHRWFRRGTWGVGIWSTGTWGPSTWPTAPHRGDPYRRDPHRRDPRHGELLAQQLLGDHLDRLEAAGWRVLHSIPLPGAGVGARIDHLAIGPAGVLAVRTVAARGRRVRIADPMVRTGRAQPQPHLRWARRAAERASFALATAVRPVLAVAEASRLDAVPSSSDVRILRDTEISTLASLGGVLKPADIEALYATARDRHTWLSV